MKRLLSALIVLTLILGCAVCHATAYGDLMEVCNCDEYVSLRRAPDTKSDRIAKVFKGDWVTFIGDAPNGFYQVSYDGNDGYILAEYLENVDSGSGEAPASFDDLPALPPYDDFMRIGDPVCEIVYDGYYVAARRAFDYSGEAEELLAVCYDSENRPLWTAFEVDYALAELNATSAFIAGTAENPYLVVFHSGKGFTARAIDDQGTLLWFNNCANQASALDTVLPGGALTTAVRADGTIYAVGYYNESPVAIDVNGNFLWKGINPDPENIYWPYEILPSESGVTVLYDSCMDEDDMVYAVTYNSENGACIGAGKIAAPLN